MADFKYSAGIDVNLNVKGASNQLKDLQKQLQQISNMKVDIGTGSLTADIEKASQAAMKLSAHLATATNPQTGNLDFTKFYTSIQKSGASLQEYGQALQNMGPAGQKAFVSLADSISKSEIPLRRTSKLVDGMWDNLKKTVGWQMSSSMIHGFIGSVQQAMGYAKDLNKSLTDIRIVTGQSSDQMATFAREANKAAKSLSTTTTDYTKASLIYYQQGLSDQEVKARTETTIKMANATGTSAQKVSDQMTAIWNNYDNGTKSLTHYADVMTALGAATASSTDEIAEGLQKFASISDTVGLSYEYAASALATITSTSRESADVVGNSLKTLFSRIQGLQLGETLDDGTTLNKYSTALAKVGISIKDSSGELKSMDSILDEMGTTWKTLANDEKMALAQTVAGVRQYTQLMTLMENWDFFKQNLNVANTSGGTLDAQAAIYAESWEAASNRVRASWEGLWDTMINSDSMITMLDGLSGIIEAMDTLTASMGGAGGVLTSFLGIATKLFAPKLSHGLRDTAYNVAMLFGVEQKIKEARNTVLDNALKTLDTDGEFGDLYGQNEAEARKAAMKSQIQASLDYAENYNNMTPLQHQIEQQYANATRAQDQRTAEAGAVLDNAKNAQFDARMDTYGSYGSGGEYSSLLERSQSLLADQAFNYMYDELGLDFQNPDNQARINAAQQHSQFVQSSDNEIKTKNTGKVLENFSSALTDFYKATNEAKGPDYLDNLTKAITALETAGYDDETTKDITKRMQKAAAQSVAEGVTANYDGFYKELIQAQGAAAGGTEFGSFLSAWLEKSFNTGIAQIDYEVEKKRGEGLRSGREQNLDGTKNIDWADTMVSAGEAMMFAFSAGQSLQEMNASIKKDDVGGTLISLVSGITNFGMSLASFSTIFKSFSQTAPKAGKWGLIAAIITTALIPAIDLFSEKIISSEERMQQQMDSANELASAYSVNENQHMILQQTIASYKKANQMLQELNANTNEWSDALYNSNSQAINLIAENNLQEGIDYENIGGQYQIKEKTLQALEEKSNNIVQDSKIAADLGRINANAEKNKFQKENLNETILDRISPTVWESIGNLALGIGEIAGGIGLLKSGFAFGTAGNVIAPGAAGVAGAGMMAAGAMSMYGGYKTATGAIDDLFIREERKKEFETALDYIEKNGIDILGKNIDEIASTLNISNDVAKQLQDSTPIISEWYSSVQANTQAQKLATENTVQSVLANNENIQAIKQETKIIKGASEEYNEAYEGQKQTIGEIFKTGTSQDKFDKASEVKNILGLGNLENFNWGTDDVGKSQLTYTYIDDNNQMQEGAVSYNSVISAQSHLAGEQSVNDYANIMSEIYNQILATSKSTDTARGLLSLLSGDNFESATNKEIAAAQKYLNAFQGNAEKLLTSLGMSAEEFSESYGMSAENFVSSWTNYQTASQRLLNSAFSGNEGYREWQANNQDLLNSISQDTGLKLYDNLNQISTLGGEDAGMAFLNGLSYILNSEGLDASDTASVMESLMSLDWSSASIGTDITSIISSLGGTIDTATGAWQNFIAAMMEASGAVPDFSSLLSQLTELIGLLGQVKPGEAIDDSLLSSLLEKYPEFRDLVMKQWDGSYKFMGSEEDLQEYQNRLNNEYSTNYEDMLKTADLLEQYTGEGGALEGFDASKLTFADLMNGDNAIALKNLLAAYKGTNTSDISNELQKSQWNYNSAAQELNQWSIGNEGVDINGTTVFRDSEGNFVNANGNIVDEATRVQAESQYVEDQTAFSSAMATIQQFVSILQSLLGMTPNQITQDANEQKASTYDTYSEFERGKLDKDPAIVDEEGNLTSAGEKQLQSLAQLYPEVSAEAERYKQILEDTNATEQEREDAQQLLEERLAAAEAAKQMGLEYNEVVEKMEELKEINKDNESFKKINNSGLAELASEALKVDKAMVKLHKEYSSIMKEINNPATKTSGLEKLGKILKDIAQLSDRATVSTKDLTDAYQRFIKKHPDGLSKIMKGDTKAMADYAEEVLKNDLQKLFKGMDWDKEIAPMMEGAQNAVSGLTEGMTYELADLPSEVQQVLAHAAATVKADGGGLVEQIEAMSTAAEGLGLEPQVSYVDVEPTTMSSKMFTDVKCTINGHNETHTLTAKGPAESKEQGGKIPYITFTKKSGGKGPGGGGGGGGGGKEPKKVANQRKSQTVKRYKENNYHRDNAERSAKLEENKKEYLYGETKIEQLEKINKLAEKEAKITADRISESRKYLVEDRQNLIKYMQKYGFEAEFDSDGFLASYEEAWTKVYEEIAALYEDNLLTEEESKIEEELKVKLEELEGALEDYENSLKELAEDIEKYEESLYDMYDSKLEQLEHRLEFRLELNEDDMSYIDFLIEALGENASKAVDRISLITQKSTALFDNIVRVKENIQAIYDLSDDPFQMWATGGLDIDGLLTEAQVEQLREHRDQLMDYMKELLEMRETIQEEVLNVFDAWTEKIDHNISAIDHYTSVLEYFKNVIDITGKDVFGMSDSFVRSIESAAIDQSMDSIEANKAYYENLVQANAEAEQALQEARARGDTESEEHWEEVVRSTSESMQSAQDALLSALENTLTMISDQFTAAMEDAVEQFNESIYASGGLEGLSNDYSLLREQADLMAEDYDKIYNLTKLTRNINKTLDDTNIIAGKQRLTKLLQEVNDLQKSGVELSKYDLEYLEAKYKLYLAQIELENAQGNKDTVQLSRDSEGNWSYVYTTNEEKVNEAQQKYEDALYEMQNMNHEYMEEMSSSMIETAQAMSEEIANLQISDFANLEEYNNKVQEIREKYEQSLNLQNEELNKVIDNNESLYETDWQNYSKYTGYKISADKDWIDSFRETTLGHLMGSESVQSDFNQTIIGLTDTLAQGLSDAAVQYFTQMNTALQAYGSSIDGFSGHIVSMTNTVKEQSDEAAKATESMGKRMEDAFSDVVTAVKEWQEIEAPKIEEELEAIKTLIEEINESIRTSAELTTDKDTSIIGSSKAIELINDSGLFGSWKINERGDINVSDGTGTETTNFVDYNAKLLEELDDAIELHANGRISDDALAEMFKRYWAYKDIVNRIYDTTNIDAEKELEEKEKELEKKLGGSIKFDTGGYTGEWGNEGKIAMLHEKELVLNANDTSNFLEALNISRQLIEMIEMNARASSLGLGEMVASTIKDTSQTIEQQVSITAEFPNATDHSEIEEAFDNLINIASQYAYRSE